MGARRLLCFVVATDLVGARGAPGGGIAPHASDPARSHRTPHSRRSSDHPRRASLCSARSSPVVRRRPVGSCRPAAGDGRRWSSRYGGTLPHTTPLRNRRHEPLDIEDDPIFRGARATDHHRRVGRSFFFGEDRVPVIDFSCENLCLAGPADSLAAGRRDGDSLCFEGLQYADAGVDGHGQPRLLRDDIE